MDKKEVKKIADVEVHKHEKKMHPGNKVTRLKKGGPTSEDRMRMGRNMSRAKNQGSK